MSSSCTFSLLKLTEVTSNREYLYMKTSSQIPDLTSLPSTLTAKKSMNTTRYIAIFLRRIQRLQTFKIPTDVIYTLMNRVVECYKLWAYLVNYALN